MVKCQNQLKKWFQSNQYRNEGKNHYESVKNFLKLNDFYDYFLNDEMINSVVWNSNAKMITENFKKKTINLV